VAGAFLYFSNTGRRLLAHSAGLFFNVQKSPVRFALPAPTGPLAIGTTELHLLDQQREDPWVSGQKRELMVSIWYPASDVDDRRLATYMNPKAAAYFTRESVSPLGLRPADIDAAGVRTHAWVDAPPDTSQGPRPVILFSPGGNQPRTLGTFLVEELASHGYIVVTVDHTYESSVIEFPHGRLAVTTLPEQKNLLKKLISVRVDDVQFVLDQLELLRDGGNPDHEHRSLPSGLGTCLDLSRVGMFGHSAGGFTTLQTMYQDPRIDAGINMDGSLGYNIAEGDFGEATVHGVDRPFMLMGAGLSGAQRLPHTHQHAMDWKSVWKNSTGWKLDLYLPEAEHFSFTDHQVILPQLDDKLGIPNWIQEGMIGSINSQHAVDSSRVYVRAFFDQHLLGEDQILLRVESPLHPFADFVDDQ